MVLICLAIGTIIPQNTGVYEVVSEGLLSSIPEINSTSAWYNVLVIPSKLSAYLHHAAAAAKLLQSCPTLCDPRDSSPRGSPVPGILQARTLEWGAIAFYNA